MQLLLKKVSYNLNYRKGNRKNSFQRSYENSLIIKKESVERYDYLHPRGNGINMFIIAIIIIFNRYTYLIIHPCFFKTREIYSLCHALINTESAAALSV